MRGRDFKYALCSRWPLKLVKKANRAKDEIRAPAGILV
jgi:hypothetical protein